MSSRWLAVFAIDLRALALLRASLALAVLIDLVDRAREVETFYGAEGLLPVELATEIFGLRVWLSPYSWLAAWPELQLVLMALTAVAAAVFAFSRWPRLGALLTWGLMVALQDRNPAIAFDGDRYLLVLLFWAVFLPGRPGGEATRLQSWGSAGLLIQVAIVYLVTGVRKTAPEWFDGTALWFALNDDLYATSVGVWLRDQPLFVTAALSHLTKWGQMLFPLLAFSPWWSGPLRAAATLFFLLFHIGLELTTDIGIFQIVGFSAWLAFLPSGLLDRVTGLFHRRGPRTPGPPKAVRVTPRWLDRALVLPLACILVVLWTAVGGVLTRGEPLALPRTVQMALTGLRLRQQWAMFHRPAKITTWYIVRGELETGDSVDLTTGKRLSWQKPPLVSASLSFRWRRYLQRTLFQAQRDPAYAAIPGALVDHLCARWNRDHPGQPLRAVELEAMFERVHRSGRELAGREIQARGPCE